VNKLEFDKHQVNKMEYDILTPSKKERKKSRTFFVIWQQPVR